MTGQARRGQAVGAGLLLCGLLILVAVRHAQAVEALIPMSFGVETPDVVVFAVLGALLAGAAALTARAHAQGLSSGAVRATGGAIALVGLLVVLGGNPREAALDGLVGGGSSTSAYSSQLFLDFSTTVPWLVGVVVVAALALLPVAGAFAASGAGATARLTRGRRVAGLAACAAAAAVLAVALEREVALVGLLGGESQQLTGADAVVWIAGLWALMALGWSTSAVRSRHETVPRLALLVPAAVLLGSVLLVIGQDGRHQCCFSYATVQESFPDAVITPAPEEPAARYVPPPVGPDLLLLAGTLAAGVGLPLALRRLQLRRVSPRASTPPG